MIRFSALCGLLFFLVGCASVQYKYRYVPGRTAVIRGGKALTPEEAPPSVRAAIAAANEIAGLPYGYGRGHGLKRDSAYDCSGATSYVLRAAGKLDAPIPSSAFRRYGEKGKGEWISIYARRGHVFLEIAGLRFDTGYNGEAEGPRWSTKARPIKRAVVRHPPGL